MSGEKAELFHYDSVLFDPFSFFSHLSGGPQGFDDSAAPPFNYSTTSSILPETLHSDHEPAAATLSLHGISSANYKAGGTMPVTANSSACSSSTTEAGAGDQDGDRNEQKERQEQEENREGKKDDDDGDDDKVKKLTKLGRKKGEKRQRDQPRFAFMTKSQIDHLEDGYRWRKYGQKAVKNSPFPRSYYRCTTQKCSVKKRVERSYQDPSIVITTYEGQHTHHYPANVRGSSHLLANQQQQHFMMPPNFLHHHSQYQLQTLAPPPSLDQQLHLPADCDLLLLQDIYKSVLNSNQA
ncbi:putative WRKY transcription factor 28 [Platanthera guangdongensis]|uniref:WRKY transcription factor 28 n=1 Tax=Platanthera guangdongensis TaxID=2320717 RepID=A0ABR2M5M8_9ASPA